MSDIDEFLTDHVTAFSRSHPKFAPTLARTMDTFEGLTKKEMQILVSAFMLGFKNGYDEAREER